MLSLPPQQLLQRIMRRLILLQRPVSPPPGHISTLRLTNNRCIIITLHHLQRRPLSIPLHQPHSLLLLLLQVDLATSVALMIPSPLRPLLWVGRRCPSF
jgi:hypothetical protein